MKRRVVLVALMLFITFATGWVVMPVLNVDRAVVEYTMQP